jgi:molybdopterin-containing oxidoreductase family membrane subunit
MQVVDSTLYVGKVAIPATPRAARNALVREIASMSVRERVWYGLLLVGLGILGVCALLALPPGWEVMGTTPSAEWGMLIVGYVVFAIMTSGLCLASSLGTVFGVERFLPFEKRHAILALLSLTTAFLVIALELHYPVRMVFGAVLVIAPSSPMWWMGVFYGGYLVILIVEVWTLFTDHPQIHKYACTGASIIGICAPATLGAVFGVLAAKPYWNGVFTPILMVASAFVGGVSLLGIVFWGVSRFMLADWQHAHIALGAARLLLAVGLLLVGALLARQVVAGLTSDDPGFRPSTEALVAGPLAPAFWGVRVFLGILIPLGILAVPRLRTPGATGLAAGLALTGIAVDRTLFVLAGEIVPRTTMAGTIGYPYAEYTPSLVEIGVLIGAASFMAFVYSLCERYLDMGEGDQHVFWPWPWLKAHDHEGDQDLEAEGVHAVAATGPEAVAAAGIAAEATGAAAGIALASAPESVIAPIAELAVSAAAPDRVTPEAGAAPPAAATDPATPGAMPSSRDGAV